MTHLKEAAQEGVWLLLGCTCSAFQRLRGGGHGGGPHGAYMLRTCDQIDALCLCPGSRLTAYELVQEELPATLIADSAAAALMAAGGVDAIVVGADRIAANGDTANKIGTYSLAVNAAKHRCTMHQIG